MVQVMVPPTLIVVTALPLASSCHLKLDPFTVAVVGAVEVGLGDGVVGDGVVGVSAFETVGVAFALFVGAVDVQDVTPRNSDVVSTNPSSLSMFLFLLRFRLLPKSFVDYRQRKAAKFSGDQVYYTDSLSGIFRLAQYEPVASSPDLHGPGYGSEEQTYRGSPDRLGE